MFRKIRPAFMLALLIATIFNSLNASAESGKDRGGADGIACKGGLLTLFLGRSGSLADQWGAKLSTQFEIDQIDFFSLTEDQILETMLKFVGKSDPAKESALRGALSKISFVPVPSVETLDTGLTVGRMMYVLLGCKREQLAVQDFDFPSAGLSRVRYVPKDYIRGKRDMALLKLHEAFVYLGHLKTNDLPTIETEARAEVASFLDAKDFAAYLLVTQVKAGIPAGANQDQINKTFLDAYVTTDLQRRRGNYLLSTETSAFAQMVDAGFDKNMDLGCKTPILTSLILMGVAEDRTYAQMAIESSPAAISNVLIDAGADVNAPTIDGLLPIHFAVQRGDTEVVQDLLDHGADKNAAWCAPGSKAGSFAKTPLDFARPHFWSGGSPWNEDLLRKLGAKRGSELSFRCPAVPKLTLADYKAAGCKVKK